MIDTLADRIKRHAEKTLSFSPGTPDAEKLAAYKAFLQAETEFIRSQHNEGASGLEVAHARSRLIDALIEHLAGPPLEAYQDRSGDRQLSIAIVAIGGYGRAELCPLSDIDLMFLYPEKSDKNELAAAQEIMVQGILYPLWDMGLKVGHSSRAMQDVINEARNDIQTKTALLESRLIAGSAALFGTFQTSYQLFYRKENPKQYIRDRLRDQKDRRAKMGGSVFMQEPDIKNAVGGLRDYHNTLWMARVRLNVTNVEGLAELNYLRGSELAEFKEAYQFLLRCRNELHFISKRPTDLLSLEVQPKIASSLGYSEEDTLERVETFMRDYYRRAQAIYQISKIVENRLSLAARPEKSRLTSVKNFLLARRAERVKQLDGFIIRGTEIASQNALVFQQDPARLIRVFRHKQQNGVEMDFELSALIRANLELIDEKVINSPGVNASFKAILQETGNVYNTLFSMHEHGVLGALMPEWSRLTCLVQHEYYHRYTADIHTLHTIRELDTIFSSADPVFQPYRKQLHELESPNLLYLILFLHDIGKSAGIKDHAEGGAEIAEPILERLSIDPEDRAQIRFIIRNHLQMARFWQRYDLDDPNTAKAFADQMENPDQLRLLYVHTFCDARGTARGLWNAYKDTLHTTLFQRSLETFKGEGKLEERLKRQKAMTQKQLLESKVEGVGQDEINAHFQLLPDRYFINTSQDEIVLHIRMINDLLKEIATSSAVGTLKPVIDWTPDVNRSYTVVNVVTWDRAGLFHKLCGAMNIAGYNILSAKAITREDHIAIDTFYVVESERGDSNPAVAKRIFEDCVRETLVSNKDIFPRLQAIMRKQDAALYRVNDNPLADSFQTQVDVYHELSLRRTILEVQATDHLGILYQISKCIYEHGFDITFARINTERGIAIDTFYVTSLDPQKETDSSQLLLLRDSLGAALEKNTAPAKA